MEENEVAVWAKFSTLSQAGLFLSQKGMGLIHTLTSRVENRVLFTKVCLRQQQLQENNELDSFSHLFNSK